jgi:hypothetical protein
MKITRRQLKRIITEELHRSLYEAPLPLKELTIDKLDTALKSLGDAHQDIVDKYVDAEIGGSAGVAAAWEKSGKSPRNMKWEDWITVYSGHSSEAVRLLGGLEDDQYTIVGYVVA